MYFLYSIGVVTFNKRWITLSIANLFSPNLWSFWKTHQCLPTFFMACSKLEAMAIYVVKQACGNEKILLWLILRFTAWISTMLFTCILCIPTYLLTYKLTYILLMQVRTNVFLDTLWCKCQCNVTLHVGSFTTSKKGVKPYFFLKCFMNFSQFSSIFFA